MRIVSKIFVAALGACGSSTSDASDPDGGPGDGGPADVQACSFRVTGATVDKISGSATAAVMDGSTLIFNCKLQSSQMARVVFSGRLKAFDGSGQYSLDGTQKMGEVTYSGNDDVTYYAATSVRSVTGTSPGCSFTFSEAPKAPKPGDRLAATFHCEGLQGLPPSKPLDASSFQRVDVVDGTFAATVE